MEHSIRSLLRPLRYVALVSVAAFAALLVGIAPALAATATLNPAHVGATNPGFQTGECPDNPNGTADFGWHFVLPGNDTDFVSISATFQNAGTITQALIGDPTDKHAFVFTPGPDTLLNATAEVNGPQTQFNLSHVCPGTTPPPNGGPPPGGGPPPEEVTPPPGGVTPAPGPTAAAPGAPTAAAPVRAAARFTG